MEYGPIAVGYVGKIQPFVVCPGVKGWQLLLDSSLDSVGDDCAVFWRQFFGGDAEEEAPLGCLEGLEHFELRGEIERGYAVIGLNLSDYLDVDATGKEGLLPDGFDGVVGLIGDFEYGNPAGDAGEVSQQVVAGLDAADGLLSSFGEADDFGPGIEEFLPGDGIEQAEPVSAIAHGTTKIPLTIAHGTTKIPLTINITGWITAGISLVACINQYVS